MYLLKTIGIQLPGVTEPRYSTIDVLEVQTTKKIALSQARRFPAGTVLTVDTERWTVLSRWEVAPFTPLSPDATPRAGEIWKPKDPRRKNMFKVRAIEDGQIVAEDGRRVSLKRLGRYQRVAQAPCTP